jgi:hypothetical protein
VQYSGGRQAEVESDGTIEGQLALLMLVRGLYCSPFPPQPSALQFGPSLLACLLFGFAFRLSLYMRVRLSSIFRSVARSSHAHTDLLSK